MYFFRKDKPFYVFLLQSNTVFLRKTSNSAFFLIFSFKPQPPKGTFATAPSFLEVCLRQISSHPRNCNHLYC